MTQETTSTDDLKSCWPLDPDGPLPRIFFSPEYLGQAFFQFGLAYWECSATTLRRGLKALLRKSPARDSLRRASRLLDMGERDNALAMAVCDDPRTRSRLPHLELVTQESERHLGRLCNHITVQHVHFTLPKILWFVYEQEPTLEAVFDWVKRVWVERPDIGSGYYLTSDALAEALTQSTIPNPAEGDKDLSRALLIFAGLLPIPERLTLLQTGARLGVRSLAELVLCGHAIETVTRMEPRPCQNDTAAENDFLSDSATEFETSPNRREERRPRLRPAEFTKVESIPPAHSFESQEIASMNRRLADSFEQDEAAEQKIRQVLLIPAQDFLSFSNLEFENIIASLRAARAARSSKNDAVQVHRTAARAAVESALRKAGLVAPKWAERVGENAAETVDSLSATLGTAREISELAEIYDPDLPGMNQWRESLQCLPVQAWPNDVLRIFRQLPATRARGEALRAAESRFVEQVQTFVAPPEPERRNAEIYDWLSALEGREIVCLMQSIDAENWPIPTAVLMRHGLDNGGNDFAKALADFLLHRAQNKICRRDLLHFIDPASALLDNFPNARRIIVTERFRDLIELGPLSLIADPSSGLSDKSLVGSTVAEIVDLLGTHLDLIGQSGDIQAFLHRPGPRQREIAETDLVEFIAAPSTMKGIYWRLREHARETLFTPLLRNSSIAPEPAQRLNSRLQTSLNAEVENIVREVKKDNDPVTRIEGRHTLQLRRYLKEGKEKIERFLLALPSVQSPREKSLQQDLLHLIEVLHLDASAEPGSQIWVESEVQRIFKEGLLQKNQHVSALLPTLCGTSTPVVIMPWSDEDTAWAQNSHDLAEFYLEAKEVSVLEIGAASLRWWARGKIPDAESVANELLVRREFHAVCALLDRAQENCAPLEPAVENTIRGLLTKGFETERHVVTARVDNLIESFGKEVVLHASSRFEVDAALDAYDAEDALEWCDLLEAELGEILQQSKAWDTDPEAAQKRDRLIRLLLKVGAAGIEESAPIHELEARWDNEYRRRKDEREHLTVVEYALEQINQAMPTLTSEATAFREHSLEAEFWLSAPRAADLAYYLRGPAAKLRTWLAASPAFELASQKTLESLVIWFLRFVEDRTRALQALDEGESTDTVLERALEVWQHFEKAGDPTTCVRSLVQAGEMNSYETLPDEGDEGHLGSASQEIQAASAEEVFPPPLSSAVVLSELGPLIDADNWAAVVNRTGGLRQDIEDADQRRRIDEIEEFAVTMMQIAEGKAVEVGSLASAARVLGAGGQVISRVKTTKRLNEIAFLLLSTAVSQDSGQRQSSLSPDVDGSWAPLLGRRGELLKQLGGPNVPVQTKRVLEQLCMGSLGAEVVERLWDAATNTTEAGAARSGLLAFLHDRSLDDHIVQQAGRHDPTIKSRLRQLLELRAVAAGRPDLVPVAQIVAEQVAASAKTVPFKLFVKNLPSAARSPDADLRITIDENMLLHIERGVLSEVQLPIAVEPKGLVPEHIEATLFPEDDVTFDDGTRRRVLTAQPVYVATEYTLPLRFGIRWSGDTQKTSRHIEGESIRIRVSARDVTGELINRDTAFAPRVDRSGIQHRIDDETLLEAYPGVWNTPAAGDVFIGRQKELERLHEFLVSPPRPSPVLLTGMRRVGKTSLLFAFHNHNRDIDRTNVVTCYLSLAEKREQLMAPDQRVGSVFYRTIAYAIGKRHFTASDHNREVGLRLQSKLGDSRRAILGCLESESLADSIMILAERLLEWLGGSARRIVFLFDEAEALVVPYRAGGNKKLELEQLLQSLRELSQTAQNVGVLLSGSNHIVEFAREYKNAFFGSCARIDLSGIDDYSEASKIVAPNRAKPFLDFQETAVRQAIEICRGMPQFMWQLGAATASLIRGGTVTRSDVRRAVQVLVGDETVDLPFRPYDVLEPIEHMLGLQGRREQDLLWLLLWRVANTSSLVADEAQQHFVIDQSLLELDDNEAWKQRLLSLVNLDILEIPRPGAFKFKIPIFAEGFRARRQAQQYTVRQQRAGSS